MGKRLEGLQRMLVIVNKLKGSNSGIPVEYTGVNLRTLQRDLQDIASLFGIRIKHEHGGYHIIEEDEQEWNRYEELLLNFDLLNALEGDSTLASYVLPEHHRPLHSEWLASLIGAIKRSHPVEFQYVLVRHDDQQVKKKVLPHFLKDSNQRWYLLAGVDRIRDLHVLDNEHFRRDTSIDVQALFRDCYGIWDQADIPVEDIELRYDALDGKFLKSVPLHHSQVVLADTPEEFRIALRLRITNDFVMELLSRSRSLEVIRPLHLRERVRHIYEAALRRNA